MAVDTKTLEGSYTNDGDMNQLDTFSPEAGELYYVEEARAVLETTGGTSGDNVLRVGARATDSNATIDGSSMQNSRTGDVDTSFSGEGTEASEPLGFFIDESDTLYVFDGFNSTNDDYYYQVAMRRVL